MPLSAGDKLGPYEILSAIGAGGMGQVYKARDTRLDRTVAIKVSKAEFGERFTREAQAVAALNHPNICTLFDVGPNYLVMEYIDGTPLQGPLPSEKAVQCAGQILDALAAAHRKGFTHRDLKPANILVTRQGIKLLDFGLAKQSAVTASDETLTQDLTKAGQVIGTLPYMSPEQLQGKPVDARSDLFAFGCVLYEMLSGRRAFGGSAASVAAAILEKDPPPLDVHLPLDRVLRRCLAKDPESRFQNALDLKAALAWAIEPPPPVTPPQRASLWPWVVTFAAAMLVLGGLIGRVVTQPRQAPASERAQRFQVLPPEGGQFDLNRGFAISRDGRALAFVATAKGRDGIWVRPVDSTTARLIAGTEGAAYPFWSPDSRSIAYSRGGKLWRMEIEGGSPVAICDVPVMRGGDWATDGDIVFSAGVLGLGRVPASGGTAEPLTGPEAGQSETARWLPLDASQGDTYHWSPQLLPGGRLLFFVAGREERLGIYGAPLADLRGRTRLINTDVSGIYAAGHLLWRRESTLVAQRFDIERLQLSGEPEPIANPVGAGTFGTMMVSASLNGLLVFGGVGGLQLSWVGRDGKDGGVLGQPGNYASFRMSPDGRRLAAARVSGSGTDLWSGDLQRDAWSRFTFLPGVANFPVWSPDSKQVMFQGGSPSNLHRKEASGAGTEQRVLESAYAQWPTDWSRDGRLVLYYEFAPDTRLDLWVLPVTPEGKPETGAKARLYLRSRFNESHGRFSPEHRPRWVAYTSDESGRNEIYLQTFPELHGKVQISVGGGSFPEWSPDGKELFYVAPGNKLMAVGLKLDAQSVVPSRPRELFAVPRGGAMQPFTTGPDGKRFLMGVPAGGAQPLEVVINWPALLKKGSK